MDLFVVVVLGGAVHVHRVRPIHHRQIRRVRHRLRQQRGPLSLLVLGPPERPVPRSRLQSRRVEVPAHVQRPNRRPHHLLQAPRPRRGGRERLLRRGHPPPPGPIPPSPPPPRRQEEDPLDHQLQRVLRRPRRRGHRQVVHRAGRPPRRRHRRGHVGPWLHQPRHAHPRRHVRRRPPHRAVRPGRHHGPGGRLPVLSGRGHHAAVHQVELPDQVGGRGAVRDGLRVLRGEERAAGAGVLGPAQGFADTAIDARVDRVVFGRAGDVSAGGRRRPCEERRQGLRPVDSRHDGDSPGEGPAGAEFPGQRPRRIGGRAERPRRLPFGPPPHRHHLRRSRLPRYLRRDQGTKNRKARSPGRTHGRNDGPHQERQATLHHRRTGRQRRLRRAHGTGRNPPGTRGHHPPRPRHLRRAPSPRHQHVGNARPRHAQLPHSGLRPPHLRRVPIRRSDHRTADGLHSRGKTGRQGRTRRSHPRRLPILRKRQAGQTHLLRSFHGQEIPSGSQQSHSGQSAVRSQSNEGMDQEEEAVGERISHSDHSLQSRHLHR
mmetsp:Transcript_21915/g.46077  ORF Transcript_21915/g.46077 Transcript_21915/m.46077 type:complete len:543 (-) Transcript_21915:932-2560(-)